MTISQSISPIHWNYFLALESDMLTLSRYIEPAAENYTTYSIELARLLISAASEVDAVLKMICKQLNPTSKARSIDRYREEIRPSIPIIETVTVSIPRYGLDFTPWINWQSDKSPNWWKAYTNVKHARDSRFQDASLQNALNALGALLVVLLVYHRRNDENARLEPTPILFEVPPSFAEVHHTVNGKTIVHFSEVTW